MSGTQSIASSPSYYPSAPVGVFGTRIPSSVCFAIGLLLFLLPFAELKCTLSKEDNIVFQSITKAEASVTNTGLGLALGSKWKMNMPEIGNWLQEQQQDKFVKNLENQKPNNYSIAALALAFAGLILSFIKARVSAGINILTGLLSAGALIGLMLDIKKNTNNLLSEMEKTGNKTLTLSFTPWFYIAIIALLTAAFFSFKRIQAVK
jgi:hypothetical protein